MNDRTRYSRYLPENLRDTLARAEEGLPSAEIAAAKVRAAREARSVETDTADIERKRRASEEELKEALALQETTMARDAETARGRIRAAFPSLSELLLSDASLLNSPVTQDMISACMTGLHRGTVSYLCENLLPAPVEIPYIRGRTHYL